MKKIVETQIGRIRYDLDGPIEKAIEYLQELKAEADEAGVTYHLNYETEHDYGDSEFQVIAVIEKREETDKEYQARLDKEATDAKARLDAKRQQLEQLKKELGEE